MQSLGEPVDYDGFVAAWRVSQTKVLLELWCKTPRCAFKTSLVNLESSATVSSKVCLRGGCRSAARLGKGLSVGDKRSQLPSAIRGGVARISTALPSWMGTGQRKSPSSLPNKSKVCWTSSGSGRRAIFPAIASTDFPCFQIDGTCC